MPKAHIALPNGTVVEIEGTVEEVKSLLEFYGDAAPTPTIQKTTSRKSRTKSARSGTSGGSAASGAAADVEARVDITEVVNIIRSCSEAEVIETKILDKSGQVNRVLLPMYIVHEHLGNNHELSSGAVSYTHLTLPTTPYV